jgi:glucokinase
MNNLDKPGVVLGVDIGGTNTKFGYVDHQGACLASASMPTNAHEPSDLFFERLQQEAATLLQSIPGPPPLVGIGIGAPNANYHKGTIEHPPNLGW